MPYAPIRARFRVAVWMLLLASVGIPPLAAQENAGRRLARDLQPVLTLLNGKQQSWSVSGWGEFPVEGKTQRVELTLRRLAADAFELRLGHADYAVHLVRDGRRTALALPKHKVVYWGAGEVEGEDHLSPEGILARTVTPGTSLAAFLPLATQTDPQILARLLSTVLPIQWDRTNERWELGKNREILLTFSPESLRLAAGDVQVELRLGGEEELSISLDDWLEVAEVRGDAAVGVGEAVGVGGSVDNLVAAGNWQGYRAVELDRVELERQLARGVRRALEILQPSPELMYPSEEGRQVPHGELRWIEGHRVVLLRGTPEQIGSAHGKLVAQEAHRCIDSVLYTFGTAQTIITGRWFRHDLEAAYARLAPYIPEDHQRECRAMAESLGISADLAEVLNVFPELFHCSGFALSGKATKDGKLYHGRVLDYMTTIGLQDAATTFIVAVDGKIPFANIGYAGFIGSVSGMNMEAISLGEMGGRGEGKWDGVPMATLMRRALEECSTLDEVTTLWETSPRTCEYYYVFADGKTNRSVGVAADPDSIQFVGPGEGHPLLGEGIEDAVVLSAGSRLETLRTRVLERYGEIDDEVAMWLMTRPVAMNSNLHNVLFVPADRVFYVANATHRQPAADRPYVRLDFTKLIQDLPGEPTGSP
jgi:hypothetical protein